MRKNFKQIITEKNMTIDQVHAKIPVENGRKVISHSTLNSWFYEQAFPNRKNTEIIAGILGVDPAVLW